MACLSKVTGIAEPQMAAAASAAGAAAETALKARVISDEAKKAFEEKKQAAERAAPQSFTAQVQEQEKSSKERVPIERQLRMHYSKINHIPLSFLDEFDTDSTLRDAHVDVAEGKFVNLGTSIFTDTLKPCVALVARCYRNGVLKRYGICHLDAFAADLDAFLKEIKDRNFTAVEFKMIGGYDTEIAEEIEGTLEEAGYPGPFEKVLNPMGVEFDYWDDFEKVCELLGFAVTAGVTRKGHIYYAIDSTLKKFDPEVIKQLNDFLTCNEANLQTLAEACKKDSTLQSFWLELVSQMIEERDEAKVLERGLKLFRSFLG